MVPSSHLHMALAVEWDLRTKSTNLKNFFGKAAFPQTLFLWQRKFVKEKYDRANSILWRSFIVKYTVCDKGERAK